MPEPQVLSINEEDKARRDFLDECDVVVRLPITWYLFGSTKTDRAKVLCLPFSFEFGIVKNKGRWVAPSMVVNAPIKETNYDEDSITLTGMREETVIGLRAFGRLKDIRQLGKINMPEELMLLLNRSKFKIWSELPEHYLKDEDVSTAFAFLLFCLMQDEASLEALMAARRVVFSSALEISTYGVLVKK